MNWVMHHGDATATLAGMDESSIDALVTDPPAGISFMNRAWDHDGGDMVAWAHGMADHYRACLRVIKPGGHGLVWALPRTSWATGLALHLAGWQIRDRCQHLFSQGFPKGQDLGRTTGLPEWSGWHTALKPAVEDWFLVRKPLSETSIGRQVATTRTGGLHVDPCRVPVEGKRTSHFMVDDADTTNRVATGPRARAWDHGPKPAPTTLGRFPPHLLLSHGAGCTDAGCEVDCACRMVASQGGWSEGDGIVTPQARSTVRVTAVMSGPNPNTTNGKGDAGHADRYFPRFAFDPDRLAFKYHGKVTPDDRGEGNTHPTVKAAGLMDWLCTLVTPPGGIILDPFAGSGSTGIAAVKGGWSFVGIEREASYVAMARERIGREAAQVLTG